MKKVIKIFSIIFFISGLAGILIVKNISYQKEMYINNLEVELRNENNKNQLYKLEWEYLISPINLQEISKEIFNEEYTKYFVVLDEDDLLNQKNSDQYQDLITVVKPKGIINSSRWTVRKLKRNSRKKIDFNQKSFSFTHRYDQEKFKLDKLNNIRDKFQIKINNRLILSSIIFSTFFFAIALQILHLNFFFNINHK